MTAKKDDVSKVKEKLVEMINGQYTCWNTTSMDATISKMIYHLNKRNLFETAEKDFKTSKRAYMGTFMDIIFDINKILPIDKNSAQILYTFRDVVEEFATYYNLHNYQVILRNDMLTSGMISAFDSDFRGNITDIIKIEDKYIIIKTYVKRDDEYQFYIKRSVAGSIKSGMYLSIEHAMCGLLCNTHLHAMIALVDDEKRVERESRWPKN